MSWVRYHCQEGRVIALAHVTGHRWFTLVVLEAGKPPGRDVVGSFASRELAFVMGDAMVRGRLSHACGRDCTAWTEGNVPEAPFED